MKLGPITESGGRFMIELVFSPKEIADMGGEEAVQRACERACEENLRAMRARLEYNEQISSGGIDNGT